MLQKKLKELMNSKNLSTAALERKTGLSRNSINNILTGASNNPSVHTLRQIARALDVSIESMLTNETFNLQNLNPEDMQILSEVSSSVLKIAQKNNLNLSLDTILNIIKEVYLYTVKSSPISVDQKFISWVIDKYK